eukprot:Partr_v1_DN27551_c0_g1_i1_m30118 putative IQ motif containing GTPase activating protein
MSLQSLNDDARVLEVENAPVVAGGRKKLAKGLTTAPKQQGSAWMDKERDNLRAYEYLCHVGEAKEWIEACINDNIGQITDLDESLRNGVVLAKLAKFFEPAVVRRIFEDPKLQFRHSDNTNYFFAACKKAGFPDLFLFELTDNYDKKNIPKVIYCIHALSHFLAKKGIAPKIKNLVGQLDFTDEELLKTENSLQEAGVALPQFGNIEGALAKELNEETPEQLREKYLEEHQAQIIKCQSMARGKIARMAYAKKVDEYKKHEQFIIRLQTQIRANKVRKAHEARLKAFEANLDKIVQMQAFIRGYQKRREFLLTRGHYNSSESVARIIKIQSRHKAKIVEKAYKSLANVDTIPVKAIQSFIHLLDDSDKDFQEELLLENLKQSVVKKIRDNNNSEVLLSDLDIKIALLVRNRITLDEVIRTQKGGAKKLSPSNSNANLNEDMFSSANFKSLDKEARLRLDLYSNLFYILQTSPKYLAKIMFVVKQTKIRSFMDHVVLSLFNYANSSREEYLLLKFFQCAIREEMKTITEIAEFLRGNPVFIKMAVHYNRGAKERLFLRDLLQPLVKDVLGNDKLDLDTDPVVIYRQLIKEEEIATGEASKRPYDVTKEDALKDPEVAKIFEKHTEDLKDYTGRFLNAIIKSLATMPYGIRYIAKQLRQELKDKFPVLTPADDEKILRVVGNLVYYRYMNPAIVAPEGFDVIEQLISPLQRKNLAEIAKMLQQVSVSKGFDSEMSYLSSVNEFVSESGKKMLAFFKDVAEVPEAEEQFQMSDMSDLAKTSKPVIYITPQEIYNTHALLADALDDISPEGGDPLRLLLKELGNPPPNTVTVNYSNNMKFEEAPNAADGARGNEISLNLSSRFIDNFNAGGAGNVAGELIAQYTATFLETKSGVLTLIRVQSGKDLVDIMAKPVTESNERVYRELLKQEEEVKAAATPMSPSSESQQKHLEHPTSLAMLKHQIADNLKKLEDLYDQINSKQPDLLKQKQLGVVKISAKNAYQEVLTSIGLDIRNKYRRRVQRRNEVRSLKTTVQNLDEKKKYLDEQKNSYQDYINSCMGQLANSRKKQKNDGTKFMMPFSPQWTHMQELKKQGKVPQFGSFKYGADVLYKKGVLVSVDGYGPKQFDKINLTLSSDETGVFSIEVSIMGIKMPQKMELKLEDLLQFQFDNVQVIPLFDGAAKVNVNLLIFLINKKFFN